MDNFLECMEFICRKDLAPVHTNNNLLLLKHDSAKDAEGFYVGDWNRFVPTHGATTHFAGYVVYNLLSFWTPRPRPCGVHKSTNRTYNIPPPPLRKHGRGPSSQAKTAVQRPPRA